MLEQSGFIHAFSVSTKPLTELEHLNLAYNNLQRAPVLGLGAQTKLTTLILRNNELETINGKFTIFLFFFFFFFKIYHS